MTRSEETKKKGTFGVARLPVALKYIYPSSQRTTMLIGGVLVLIVVALFLFNTFFQKSLISNGPLSSNHANYEKDCKVCHTTFASVKNEKCSVCHEKYGENPGGYTYAAHYFYRSKKLKRDVPFQDETPCFSCHPEHLGREMLITKAPDSRCFQCHQFGSFNDKHPQFEFVTKQTPDDSSLKFTHILHVKEIKKRENLGDNIEKACLYCHNPQADGKTFQSITFERHCETCHLATSKTTPWLNIKDNREPNAVGVETLETINKRHQSDTLLTFYSNSNDFKRIGNRLRKSPVYHKDPWIMENLKTLRRTMYPGLELADLFEASSNASPNNARFLYKSVIQLLLGYLAELRTPPKSETQNELVRIDRLIKVIEKKIEDPNSPLDITKFQLSSAKENPNLTPGQIETFTSFVNELTTSCRLCHMVTNASIARVQKEQGVLYRAEFNHRAHIFQRRCLHCHTKIPFLKYASESVSMKMDQTKDCSAIQNIPRIETCQICHNAEAVSNRCVTCHNFHPNKANRSNLLF